MAMTASKGALLLPVEGAGVGALEVEVAEAVRSVVEPPRRSVALMPIAEAVEELEEAWIWEAA